MPFSLYKTFRFGPLVVVVSPRGLGFSIGAGGVRVGRSASGRRRLRLNKSGTRVDVPLDRRA